MQLHSVTMTDDSVNIRIKKDTWRELHQQKEPNDSFDDVIQRLLQKVEAVEGNEDPRAKTRS